MDKKGHIKVIFHPGINASGNGIDHTTGMTVFSLIPYMK